MNTPVKVARYHLVFPFILVIAPWAILAFTFVVNLIPTIIRGGPNPTKALAAIFAMMVFAGVLSMTRSLPFALALGASRRSYYLGTVALVVALAVIYGLAIAGLQALERATRDLHHRRRPCMASRRPFLHHPHRRRVDGCACRARCGAVRRRVRPHAPGDGVSHGYRQPYPARFRLSGCSDE